MLELGTGPVTTSESPCLEATAVLAVAVSVQLQSPSPGPHQTTSKVFHGLLQDTKSVEGFFVCFFA